MTQLVDRARRDRLRLIKGELDRVDRDAARALWEWGMLFGEVDKAELWREDGATSFTAWVEEETPYSQQTARRAIDVARHFTAEMCERWGSTKLAAALRLMSITGRDEQPGDVTALQIRIRDDEGRYTSVKFADASAKDIQVACQQLIEGETAKKKREEAKGIDQSVRAQAVRLQKVLPEAPKGTSKGDRVIVQKGRDGQVAVTFKAIPIAELRAFVDALEEHMLG